MQWELQRPTTEDKLRHVKAVGTSDLLAGAAVGPATHTSGPSENEDTRAVRAEGDGPGSGTRAGRLRPTTTDDAAPEHAPRQHRYCT